MYLKRKIDDYLEQWRAKDDRLPLIIKGARQTGKTESVKHFARKNYANTVYINFVLEPKYKTILSDGYEVNSILKNISLIDTEKRFVPRETILIFDELQDFPDIATCLKAFATDGRYDVICSGSLLGLHYRKIHSNSVGYKTDYVMHSLDFEEFLWAKGYSEELISELLEYMLAAKPFSRTATGYFSLEKRGDVVCLAPVPEF